jgi:hypothetical protein
MFNRFWPFSDSWHVTDYSSIRHAMHGMGFKAWACVPDEAGNHMGVRSVDRYSVGVHGMDVRKT